LDDRLKKTHIVLGVTGSIAAYKACMVLRQLIKQGAEVRVVMTKSAQKFVHPLTFETLSGNEVITQLFSRNRVVKTRHISLAEWADCILICPATLNVIGKIASGIADDFLTTVVTASRAPVIIAPAMDYEMVRNPIYLDNCEKLKRLGYLFVSTEEGDLASGLKGAGRLASLDRIEQTVKSALFRSEKWKGKSVLVTAGPTREALDPVRFLTNRSSGKMGFALAQEAALRGSEVTLITGPNHLSPVENVKTILIESASDMADAVEKAWPSHDVLIMAAAVADYHPKKFSKEKIKKSEDTLQLQLERTIDILKKASAQKNGRITVGFALETRSGEKEALRKLKEKNLDLICLNNSNDPGAGFQEETNQVTLIDSKGDKEAFPLLPKWEVAQKILNKIEALMPNG